MRRHSVTAICLLLCLTLSTLSNAEVYKTVDKYGRVTFSDVPPPDSDAKPIELKPINTLPPTETSPIKTVIIGTSTTPQAMPGYEINITAPENGTTLMANERSVTVSINLNQDLHEGDLLAYKIDGDTIEKTAEHSITLNEPPRGEHAITVEVVDSDEKSLAQSDAVTLLVMRPLVKQTATPTPKK
jgi:hypothetical protein